MAAQAKKGLKKYSNHLNTVDNSEDKKQEGATKYSGNYKGKPSLGKSKCIWWDISHLELSFVRRQKGNQISEIWYKPSWFTLY